MLRIYQCPSYETALVCQIFDWFCRTKLFFSDTWLINFCINESLSEFAWITVFSETMMRAQAVDDCLFSVNLPLDVFNVYLLILIFPSYCIRISFPRIPTISAILAIMNSC